MYTDQDQLKLRAYMSVDGNIISMKYMPDFAKKGRYRHYLVKLKRDKQEDPPMELDYEWVEDNFREDFLRSVKSMHDNHNHIMIPLNKRIQQYSKARYSSKEERFYLMKEDDKQRYFATEEWMTTNFEAEFVEELKRRCLLDKYVQVPVGDTKPFDDVTRLPWYNKEGPSIVFAQGNKKYCAVYSFGSVLHYLKYPGAAHEIIAKAIHMASASSRELIQRIVKLMQHSELKYLQAKVYKRHQLDLLKDISPYPTIAILEGDDGSVSHAVSTIGIYLFDSNLNHAPYISQEVLDWCVSSPDENCEYVGIAYAVRFSMPANQKKRTWSYNGSHE